MGNALVAVVFLAYSFFGAVYPVARGAAIVVGLALLPWVVVKSLSFNANNTLFRGMRFRFRAGLTEAFGIYLVLPIIFTAGLAVPWVTIRSTRYLVSCLEVNLAEDDALKKIDTMGSI